MSTKKYCWIPATTYNGYSILLAAFGNNKDTTSRAAARKLMVEMEQSVHGGNYQHVRTLFEEVDTDKLSIHSLIAIVRSSFRYRSQIPLWECVYQRCWKRVEELGHDPKRIYVGMDKPQR